MGLLIINRDFDFIFSKMTVTIGDNIFKIRENEVKEVEIPDGKYMVEVSDGIFFEGKKEIIVSGKQKTTINLKTLIPTWLYLLMVGILLASFVLIMIEFSPYYVFYLCILFCLSFLFVTYMVKRSKFIVIR